MIKTNRLAEIREKHGYTQIQIAEHLNITQAAYSQYESGKRMPNINILIKLADFYMTSLDILVGRHNVNS